MSTPNLFPLAGSHRPEPAHPNIKGKLVDGHTIVEITFRVATEAAKNPDKLAAYFEKRNNQVKHGHPVTPLTAKQYAARYGAKKNTMQAVRRHMKQHYPDLAFASQTQYNGDITYRGTLTHCHEVADFTLVHFVDKHGHPFMARVGEISLKDEFLAGIITSVRGLDTRKQGHTHARPALDEHGKPKKPHDVDNSWTVTDLAERFNVPVALLNKLAKMKVTIGLVELGGGYTASDNQQAAAKMGVDQPDVGDVLVGGASNDPGKSDADGEVDMDIQACFFLGKNCKILVGQAPNTGKGFADLIEALIDAGCDVISVSWGMGQKNWGQADIDAMEAALARADALGIVVMVASGDTGSGDASRDGKNDVDFPSASEHATGACGLFVGKDGSIRVWNDDPTSSASGGGVGTNPVPSFQKALQAAGKLPKNADTGAAGRCVGDLAADADPNSGVVVLVNGVWMVIGGTSFAAPFIAAALGAIICLIGKRLVGFNTYIYQFGYVDGFIIDVKPPGNNGAYEVLDGYDCPTGLGYIDFTLYLKSLQKRGFAPQFDLDLAA